MKEKVPHDALIKRMLEEPGFPKEFFDTLLPVSLTQHLKWESLKQSPTSFVDEELKQHFSDAFFEVELNLASQKRNLQIALLIEHKSSPDKFVVLQLMRYLLQAYLHQIKGNKRPKRLIPILPLVVYHGNSGWKAKNFAALFGDGFEDFSAYFPELPFLFYNINQLSDEEIFAIEYTMMRALWLTHKYSHDSNLLFLYIGKIAEIFIDGNMPAALLVYVSKALGNNFTKEQILAQITPAMATKFKSFYDKLIDEGIEKGIEKGIEMGMEKGMEKAKLNTVQRMTDLGLTIEQIAFSVELSVEEVKAILKK